MIGQGESERAPTPASGEGSSGWPHPSWGRLLALGASSRVVVVLAGCLLARGGVTSKHPVDDERYAAGNARFNQRHAEAIARGPARWIAPWYRWDGMWYAEVSARGYNYEPGKQCSTGFMPLLPLLMAGGQAAGLDRYWAGLLAANLAFAVGLACFGRATLRATGEAGVAWRACLLLMAYPRALFFSAPYTESLAFALSSAAVLAWLDRRPVTAASALALASAARLTAAAMSVGVLAEWAGAILRRRPAPPSAWFIAAAGMGGFVAFCSYLGWRFGDPWVYLQSHAAWGRKPASLGNVGRVVRAALVPLPVSPCHAVLLVMIFAFLLPGPLRAIRARLGLDIGAHRHDRAFRWLRITAVALAALTATGQTERLLGPRNPLDDLGHVLGTRADLLAIPLFLGLGVRLWARLGPLWGCLVLVPILQGMATGSAMSLSRVALAAFPAFIEAAELLRAPATFRTCLALALCGQYASIDEFVHWRWAG